jgi:hypothetical protein
VVGKLKSVGSWLNEVSPVSFYRTQNGSYREQAPCDTQLYGDIDFDVPHFLSSHGRPQYHERTKEQQQKLSSTTIVAKTAGAVWRLDFPSERSISP